VNELLGQAWAPSTVTRYRGGMAKYARFCRDSGRILQDGSVEVPREVDLLEFVGHAHGVWKMSAAAVQTALCAVGHWCRCRLGIDPFEQDNGRPFPRLRGVLRGLRRKTGKPRKPKEPLTTDRLLIIVEWARSTEVWGSQTSGICAALCLAVFGMLRVSEYAASRRRGTDEEDTLGGDLRWITAANGTVEGFELVLRRSKTDPFRRGQTLRLFNTGTAHCPVANLKAFVTGRLGLEEAPLFRLADGSNLTRGVLAKAVKQAASALGWNPKQFSTHSCRAGGCVSAAAAGAGTGIIAALGRWRSSCYKDYLRLTAKMVAETQGKMARVSAVDVTQRQVHGVQPPD